MLTIVSLRALGTNGLKSSVPVPCNICFLKTINETEVQQYLFVFNINGLSHKKWKKQ